MQISLAIGLQNQSGDWPRRWSLANPSLDLWRYVSIPAKAVPLHALMTDAETICACTCTAQCAQTISLDAQSTWQHEAASTRCHSRFELGRTPTILFQTEVYQLVRTVNFALVMPNATTNIIIYAVYILIHSCIRRSMYSDFHWTTYTCTVTFKFL